MRRRLLALLAFACAAAALMQWAAPGPPPARALAVAGAGDPARGRQLFLSGCSYCHGTDARGVAGRGPSLEDAGAAAADFYLSTGRMPLSEPGDAPARSEPAYSAPQRADLVAFVGSLGGPAVPQVDPEAGDLGAGFKAFGERCAGCHAITGQGGIVPGRAVAPALQEATPAQVAEAVRVGPYVMPAFPEEQIDQRELDSITRYVLSTRSLPDEGGWGIGNIGPIPEGMIAWLLAGTALLLVLRLLGERSAR